MLTFFAPFSADASEDCFWRKGGKGGGVGHPNIRDEQIHKLKILTEIQSKPLLN